MANNQKELYKKLAKRINQRLLRVERAGVKDVVQEYKTIVETFEEFGLLTKSKKGLKRISLAVSDEQLSEALSRAQQLASLSDWYTKQYTDEIARRTRKRFGRTLTTTQINDFYQTLKTEAYKTIKYYYSSDQIFDISQTIRRKYGDLNIDDLFDAYQLFKPAGVEFDSKDFLNFINQEGPYYNIPIKEGVKQWRTPSMTF